MLDVTPTLFLHTADLLKTIPVVPDKYSEAVLASIGMSQSWHALGKMAIFFVVADSESFSSYYPLPPTLFFFFP